MRHVTGRCLHPDLCPDCATRMRTEVVEYALKALVADKLEEASTTIMRAAERVFERVVAELLEANIKKLSAINALMLQAFCDSVDEQKEVLARGITVKANDLLKHETDQLGTLLRDTYDARDQAVRALGEVQVIRDEVVREWRGGVA